MLDEKDLQAIQKMIDASESRMAARIDESEARTTSRIDESESRMAVLMESYFDPKFNLLADGLKDVQEKLVPRSRVDDLEDDIRFLKLMYRQMAERVATLEKAN